MRFSCIAISDFEDDCASFLLDVIEQVLRTVQHIQKEVDRFLLLHAVEDRDSNATPGDFGEILPVVFERVRVTAESKGVFPPDPRCTVSDFAI